MPLVVVGREYPPAATGTPRFQMPLQICEDVLGLVGAAVARAQREPPQVAESLAGAKRLFKVLEGSSNPRTAFEHDLKRGDAHCPLQAGGRISACRPPLPRR